MPLSDLLRESFEMDDVDELAVRLNGELHWLYVAIDIETKLLLRAELFEHRGTDAVTAFLRSLDQKHDLADTVFLVDGYGYLTSLARLDLSDQLDYSLRNYIETALFRRVNSRS